MYSSYYTTQQHVHRSLTTAICVAPLLQHIPFHPKILFPFLPRSFLVAPCRLLLHCWTLYHKLLQADCQKSKPTHGVWACTVGSYLQLAPPPPGASKGELGVGRLAPSGRLCLIFCIQHQAINISYTRRTKLMLFSGR